MSREIITALSQDKDLMRTCKVITQGSDLWEDLFQQTMVILLEKPSEMITEAYKSGKLKAFAIKIFLNQWSGRYSQFNTTTARLVPTLEYSDYTPIPTFSQPTITEDTPYWEGVIKDKQYHIIDINPSTITVVKVMETMATEDKSKEGGSGMPYRTIVFNNYLRLGSVRKVATELNINFMSIQRTITEVKQIIRSSK